MNDMHTASDGLRRNRPISVAEYHRLGEAGIIAPDERVELLNGELLQMPPIGPEHADIAMTMYDVLHDRFRDRAKVRTQLPVTLDHESEPQPDVMLARLPALRYRAAHPTAADALLVIEVSDSSIAHDRGEKLAAYARAGIPEYWIVNLSQRVIERFRDPSGPRYASTDVAQPGASLAPVAFPDDPIAVCALLGIES